MSTRLQRGFSAVEVVVAVFVVAAIAATGYLAYGRMQDANKTPTAVEQTDKATTPNAPAVEDTTGLEAAAKALDDTNIDASVSDSGDLDSELEHF